MCHYAQDKTVRALNSYNSEKDVYVQDAGTNLQGNDRQRLVNYIEAVNNSLFDIGSYCAPAGASRYWGSQNVTPVQDKLSNAGQPFAADYFAQEQAEWEDAVTNDLGPLWDQINAYSRGPALPRFH